MTERASVRFYPLTRLRGTRARRSFCLLRRHFPTLWGITPKGRALNMTTLFLITTNLPINLIPRTKKQHVTCCFLRFCLLFNRCDFDFRDGDATERVAVFGVAAAVAQEEVFIVGLENRGGTIAAAFIVLDDIQRSEISAVFALLNDERRSAPGSLKVVSSIIIWNGVVDRIGDAVVGFHLQRGHGEVNCPEWGTLKR